MRRKQKTYLCPRTYVRDKISVQEFNEDGRTKRIVTKYVNATNQETIEAAPKFNPFEFQDMMIAGVMPERVSSVILSSPSIDDYTINSFADSIQPKNQNVETNE